MRDIKSDFREWLQKHFSKSTEYSYYALVQKIFDKNFGDNKDWQQYSENIMPLLVRYFEFANREYYLDRVTIWYALDYFKKIADYIQSGHLKNTRPDVDIYIFDGNKNYFVCSTGITELYDNVVFIQRYLFESTDDLQYKDKNLSIDALKLVILLKNIKESGILQNIRDAAIYIAYNNPNNSAEKTALSRYCDFMYALTANPAFDYKNIQIINMITKENPMSDINNFDEIAMITGEHARRIKPNIKTKRFTDGHYVYSAKDLAKIFDIDYDTATNLMNRFGQTFRIDTVSGSYYCEKATNLCLRYYHHYRSRKKSSLNIDYTKAGYEQWKTRTKAMKLLGIKKLAFYTHVAGKCLYIDYAKGAPRYYLPELKYFKNSFKIRSIRNRKNNIKKTIR